MSNRSKQIQAKRQQNRTKLHGILGDFGEKMQHAHLSGILTRLYENLINLIMRQSIREILFRHHRVVIQRTVCFQHTLQQLV